MIRRTKIVATIGPATDGPGQLRGLLAAGVDVARVGFAHGSIADHRARIANIRQAAADVGRSVAVLGDLPGPKIRTAPFPEGGVFLPENTTLHLAPGTTASTAARIEVVYDSLLEDVQAGDVLALGDGAIALLVEGRDGDHLVARVVSAGRVQGRPGAHLPSERLRVSTPTEQDFELIAGLAADVDYLAVSFVRTAEDIETARRAAGPDGPLLVAKIETRAACDRLDAIVETSDAVMVARGDLGTECAIEEVPHLQKRIVRQCVATGTPAITATQMLESMINSPMPTRAEASDVANAVFDGTDAVMLSAETAIGHNPALVVRTMAKILMRAEREADYLAWGGRLGRLQRKGNRTELQAISAAMTHAAWSVAVELGAAAIVCCTRSGFTARAMARFRPPMPLVAFSPNEKAVRELALSWGVDAFELGMHTSADEIVWHAVEMVVSHGLAQPGDELVVLAGAPDDDAPTSDVLRVVRVH
jgi:pyruvate kinase